MALSIGDPDAQTGMTKAIYDRMQAAMEPDLEGLAEPDKVPVRESWKKMAFAVATGVIEHLVLHMEVNGVRCAGAVNAKVEGDTGAAPPDSHVHALSLSAVQNGATFLQNNDGTGHVR